MSSGAKKDLLDAGILSHEEQLSILRTELATKDAETRSRLMEQAAERGAELGLVTAQHHEREAILERKLEAMERARDGWREEWAREMNIPRVHGKRCKSKRGKHPELCDCPAALDLEAEKEKSHG